MTRWGLCLRVRYPRNVAHLQHTFRDQTKCTCFWLKLQKNISMHECGDTLIQKQLNARWKKRWKKRRTFKFVQVQKLLVLQVHFKNGGVFINCPGWRDRKQGREDKWPQRPKRHNVNGSKEMERTHYRLPKTHTKLKRRHVRLKRRHVRLKTRHVRQCEVEKKTCEVEKRKKARLK